MITIQYNGKNLELEKDTTIDEFIKSEGLQNKRIAIEVNQAIIPRSDFSQTTLKTNDRLEVIHAIGGG